MASTEFIGLSLCIYIFVNYARTRQLKNYMKTEKPMELQSVTAIKQEDFLKAQDHSKDVLAFQMYQDYNEILIDTLLWAFCVPAYVWGLSAKILYH